MNLKYMSNVNRQKSVDKVPDGYLNVIDYARAIGVASTTVYKYAKEGKIEYIYIKNVQYFKLKKDEDK